MGKQQSYEKSRLKELLWRMIVVYHPSCVICNKPFVKADVLPSRGVDLLTEHHKDGNHWNNEASNFSLAHRDCHKRYHTKDNLKFSQMFK